MTKGVLLFALNNESVDYTKLAVFAASRVKKYLNVDVTVVTNDKLSLLKNDKLAVIDNIVEIEDDTINNNRRFYDGSENFKLLTWKNSSRHTSYNLSPYDETLVIDVDYIINSSTLEYCWNSPYDFLIYKSAFDISELENIKYVSEYSIPFYWATVFYFKKTSKVEQFFNLILYIKENWNYYRLLYNLPDRKFRNDFAFSIAIHIMSGYSGNDFINYLPGKLFYLSDRNHLLKSNDTSFTFLVETINNNYVPLKITSIDIHFMNKFSLLRNLNDI